MRKTEQRVVEKTETVTVDLLCNRCGESLKLPHGDGFAGLEEAKVAAGYGDTFLVDGTTYTFSICQKCCREMFDAFKIPPTIGDYLGEPYKDYAEERASWSLLYARWTQTDEDREMRRREGLCAAPGCPEKGGFRTTQHDNWTLVCEAHLGTHDGYQRWHPLSKERGEPGKGKCPIYFFEVKTGELYAACYLPCELPTMAQAGVAAMDTIDFRFHKPEGVRAEGFIGIAFGGEPKLLLPHKVHETEGQAQWAEDRESHYDVQVVLSWA